MIETMSGAVKRFATTQCGAALVEYTVALVVVTIVGGISATMIAGDTGTLVGETADVVEEARELAEKARGG